MKGVSRNTRTQKRILFYTSGSKEDNHAWDWITVRSKGLYPYGIDNRSFHVHVL